MGFYFSMFLDSIKYSLCTSIVLLHHIWIQMLSEKALGPPNQIPDTSSEITWIHRAIGYVYCIYIYIYQWKWLELAVQSRPISRIFACHKAPHNHEWICINRLDILFFFESSDQKEGPLTFQLSNAWDTMVQMSSAPPVDFYHGCWY